MKHISVIIAAAGSSRRLQKEKNKILLDFQGKPVLAYSLSLFSLVPEVKEMILVAAKGEEDQVYAIGKAYCGETPFSVVQGGKERMNSIHCGLNALSKECDTVMIHDGARPFLSQEGLGALLSCDFTHGAILALPQKETMKVVTGDIIEETLDRHRLYSAQTPQIFPKEVILKAYKKGIADGFFATDDASLVEHWGGKVQIVMGEESNIKITTPHDWEHALKKESPASLRIGSGYDVHSFLENRPLVLCGVHIPYEKGLAGHSDADVATHALMDALLGAAALGDIGKHFPPDDDCFLNADSLELLRDVCSLLAKQNYEVVNVDITIMAEEPKLLPHISLMRDNIAITMDIPIDLVSVKATTTEKLGFVGRKEGIAASASVLIAHKF